MKGYIYPMFKGADPGKGWQMTDPIFGKVPTLGACMPNIRRVVTPGDYIFVISGQAEGVTQYVVGGFEVAEKINAMAAYKRFPGNRQHLLPDGSLRGNIIVDSNGKHSSVDYHNNFEKRVENYIVGKNPLVLETPKEIVRARKETLDVLSTVFKKTGRRISDIIGRWRRLDDLQIGQMLDWMQSLK
jgi:hypothetical protein